MMFVVTLFLSFLAQTSGTSCDSSAVAGKSGQCIAQMSSNMGAGVCNAWNGYICCLKDAFAGCGMDSQIDTIVNTMKTTYSGMYAEIGTCGAASCSGGSSGQSPAPAPPSPPAPVATVLTAMIQMSDPTNFNLTAFKEAVKTKTGSSAVEAVVKFWEVALKYSVPAGTTEATLKAAIAKAMNVALDKIKVVLAGVRRLGDKRRLATSADVTLTAPDSATAKTLMTDSGDSAKLSNLGTELGGTVTTVETAKAKAKVETTVSTLPSQVNGLTAQVESVGSDVGGTITATVGTPTNSLESNSSNSKWSLSFAPLLILLVKVIQ
jgi:hypothetical protein